MDISTQLFHHLVRIISETNGITLEETLELTQTSAHVSTECKAEFKDFLSKLYLYEQNRLHISDLLGHHVGKALREYFKKFPLKEV